MSFFSRLNPFKKKIGRRAIASIKDEDKMNLDIAILMREVLTSGFMENYSVSTNSTMSTMMSMIRTALRNDYSIEIELSDESFVIDKTTLRKMNLVSVSEPVNKKKNLQIKYWRLDITIASKNNRNVHTILRVNPSNFNAFYLIQKGVSIDLTGIFPDCKPFMAMASLYRSVNREKDEEPPANVLSITDHKVTKNV